MSWLFSQALVEASSAVTYSDGEPSAPSSGNPTQLAYLPPDRMTAFSRPSRSGMTFKPLTEDLGAAVLTLCLEASRARTSAWPAKAQESTGKDQACGATWRGSLARFDPATSLWKTAQHSLLEDLGESSVTWPRSGMTAGGQCWELPTLGRRISGTGSGLSPYGVNTFHTPGATNGLNGGSNSRRALAKKATWPTPTASQARSEGMLMQLRALVDAGTLTREEAETMAQGSLTPPRMKPWPTPTVNMVSGGPNHNSPQVLAGNHGINLAGAVAKWPTPTVCGNYNRKGASPKSGDGLATAVTKCATPTARDWRSGKASQATHDKNSRPLSEQIGGSLNPTWVEWLMGWPLGWTDLKPLAMDKSRSALLPRGDC